MPAFFVTGTDTEIGKTTIAAGLLHAARSAGPVSYTHLRAHETSQ
ncbi:AAA family ATPase, partial [Pseudomonas aeruginosa]